MSRNDERAKQINMGKNKETFRRVIQVQRINSIVLLAFNKRQKDPSPICEQTKRRRDNTPEKKYDIRHFHRNICRCSVDFHEFIFSFLRKNDPQVYKGVGARLFLRKFKDEKSSSACKRSFQIPLCECYVSALESCNVPSFGILNVCAICQSGFLKKILS